MSSNEPIVYVVDDDESVRNGIVWLLDSVGIAVGAFESGDAFIERLKLEERPACAVVDVRMPGRSGLDLQEELAAMTDTLPVIILTAHGDASMATKAMKSGAFDFVEKPFNNQELLDLIQRALRFSSERLEAQREKATAVAHMNRLTAREREVMDLVLEGNTNQQISERLSISKRTVEVHRAGVMEKMESRSLAHLMKKAFLLGLIE